MLKTKTAKTIGKKEVKDNLDYYKLRKKKAEEKGFLQNNKYKSVISEIDVRICALKDIISFVDKLPIIMDDTVSLIRLAAEMINKLFNLQAGHKNEPKLMKAAYKKALTQYSEQWEIANLAIDVFNDPSYNYEDKEQISIDITNFLAQMSLFFISYREIICKIDKK